MNPPANNSHPTSKYAGILDENAKRNLQWKYRRWSNNFDEDKVTTASRFGFPAPLPKPPFHLLSSRYEPDNHTKIWNECRDNACAILESEGVEVREADVYMRVAGEDGNFIAPTLLITTADKLPSDVAKSVLLTIGHMFNTFLNDAWGLHCEIVQEEKPEAKPEKSVTTAVTPTQPLVEKSSKGKQKKELTAVLPIKFIIGASSEEEREKEATAVFSIDLTVGTSPEEQKWEKTITAVLPIRPIAGTSPDEEKRGKKATTVLPISPAAESSPGEKQEVEVTAIVTIRPVVEKSPEKKREKRITPLKETHPIAQKWRLKLKERILDVLYEAAVEYQEVGLFNYGHDKHDSVPTVVLMVKDPSLHPSKEVMRILVDRWAEEAVYDMPFQVLYNECLACCRMGPLMKGFYKPHPRSPGTEIKV